MAARSSPPSDLPRLVRDLSSPDLLRRESAVARLTLAGERAIRPAFALASDTAAPAPARTAALRILAATDAPRALDVARVMLRDGDDDVASEAIEHLREVLLGPEPAATRAFEHLAEFASSASGAADRRLAALAALETLPAAPIAPLYEALARDGASPVVRQAVRRKRGGPSIDALVESGFEVDPAVASAIVRDLDDDVRLGTLKRAVDGVRRREQGASLGEREAWLAVRGALHQRLGDRRSRIALYDLRETLAAANGPLPVGYLAAASTVGDASCLVAIAQAWVNAARADRWWREHLAEAFGTIVTREGITRRDPAMAKLLRQWPSAAVLVAKARKP